MRYHTKSLLRIIRRNLPHSSLTGAEIGVWRGENAEHLLRSLPQLFLWLVDSYKFPTTAGELLNLNMTKFTQQDYDDSLMEADARTKPFGGRCRLLHCASLIAAAQLPNSLLDFVFLDGSHDYQSVVEDITAWEPKVRVGGLVIGHDYNGKGDAKGWFGVKRAVDEHIQRVGKGLRVYRAHVWWYQK